MGKLKLNTTLYTKDGRRIGNAIVTGSGDDVTHIKTDYGNEASISRHVLKDLFWVGVVALSSHKNFVTIEKTDTWREYDRLMNIYTTSGKTTRQANIDTVKAITMINKYG